MAGEITRVVLDRRELAAVVTAAGVGVYEWAADVVEDAADNAPDATPYGVGIVTGGGVVAYANGRKIGSWAAEGEPDTPRELGSTGRGEIAVAGGFRFPARFQELGTVRHGAQPFLSPALSRGTPQLAERVAAAVKRRARGG